MHLILWGMVVLFLLRTSRLSSQQEEGREKVQVQGPSQGGAWSCSSSFVYAVRGWRGGKKLKPSQRDAGKLMAAAVKVMMRRGINEVHLKI